MIGRIVSFIGFLIPLHVFAVPTDKTHSTNPLIGSWTWTREVNNCTEVYTFNANGTPHVSSGEEVSDSTYQLSSTPSEKGFYKLTDKVVRDYGGKDCAEDESDSTGSESSNFVIFHQSGDMYLLCQSEALDICIGPLKRLPK